MTMNSYPMDYRRRIYLTLFFIVSTVLIVGAYYSINLYRYSLLQKQLFSQRVMRFSSLYDSICFYDQTYGHLPDAVTYDSKGVPLYSWRFSLIPFLTTIDKIDLSTSWKSPENFRYSDRAEIFYCDAQDTIAKEKNVGTITSLISPESAIRLRKSIPLNAVPPDTILFLECKPHAVHWMAPGDTQLGIETISRLKHHQELLVCFADGEIWLIKDSIPDHVLILFSSTKRDVHRNREVMVGKYKIKTIVSATQ